MPSESKKILVVEDDRDNAELIENQLKLFGYSTIFVTSNGPDALRAAREELPDLILMDISLPGMSGLEAARSLKNDASTRAIPILAVTARAMPGDRRMCLENGCDGYLAKPYVPAQLKAEMEKLLGSKS